MSSQPPSPTGVAGSPDPDEMPGVRLAMPAEARQISELQRRAWAAADLTRRMLDEVDPEQMAQLWHLAITRPPLAHFRVLVATNLIGRAEPQDDGGQRRASVVCGFAAIGPSDDPDAEADDALVAEFVIDPLHRGQGHEDRLLHAVVETLRADGYRRATWWLASDDDQLRSWLTSTGWGPDGAHREVGTEDGALRSKQVRMHTDITPG